MTLQNFATTFVALAATVLVPPAAAQQWNEIPAPTGKEAVHRPSPAAFRTDVIDVPLRGNGAELEYMVRMKAGDTVVYSWEVQSISNPEAFLTEFHGHTDAAPGGRGDLMFYEKAAGHSRIRASRQREVTGIFRHTAAGAAPAPWHLGFVKNPYKPDQSA